MILDKVFRELLYSWISYRQTRIFWLIIPHFLMGNPALSDGQSRTFWQAKVKVKRRWKNSNPTNTLPSITSYIICALVKSATNWLLFPQSNPNFFQCFNHKSRRQNCNVNQFLVKVPFFLKFWKRPVRNCQGPGNGAFACCGLMRPRNSRFLRKIAI